MSNQVVLKIPQFSDRIVFEKLIELLGDTTQFNGQLPGQTISSLPYDAYGNLSSDWKEILDLDSALIISIYVGLVGISFSYYRGGSSQNSTIFDELHINIDQNTASPEGKNRLIYVALAKKLFKSFDPERTLKSSVDELSAQSNALHESALAKLEDVATRIASEMAHQQIKLADDFLKRRSVLEDDFRNAEIRLSEDFGNQVEELREKEKDLERRQASIDDRNNTHARRETRNKLLQDVKERIEKFGVTAVTERKRLPIMLAFTFISIVLIFLALATWVEISEYHRTLGLWIINLQNGTPKSPNQIRLNEYQSLGLVKADLYILWIRLSFIVVSIVGIALYFIRWQARWAEQHSGAEFQLQQFYLDVNRANWIVESGLEWQKETGFAIPNDLLDQLTRNLFRSANEAPAAIHPADELASALLGSASKLKLKVAGNEIEFDKPEKIPEKIKPA